MEASTSASSLLGSSGIYETSRPFRFEQHPTPIEVFDSPQKIRDPARNSHLRLRGGLYQPARMMSSRLTRSALAAARRRVPQPEIRSYATAATSGNVKPPIPLFGVDGTYASALVLYFFFFASIVPFANGTCVSPRKALIFDIVKSMISLGVNGVLISLTKRK